MNEKFICKCTGCLTMRKGIMNIVEGRKDDKNKMRFSLLIQGMPKGIKSIVEVLEYGAIKYEPHSWQKVPKGLERYQDALYRHVNNEDGGLLAKDPESGLMHIAHIACNALFILELVAKSIEDKEYQQEKQSVVEEITALINSTVTATNNIPDEAVRKEVEDAAYFTVFKEILKIIESSGVKERTDLNPEISVAGAWSKYWENKDLDSKFGFRIKKASRTNSGRIHKMYHYPINSKIVFIEWLKEYYIRDYQNAGYNGLRSYLRVKVYKNIISKEEAFSIIKAFSTY